MILTVLYAQVWAPWQFLKPPKLYRCLNVLDIEDVPGGIHTPEKDDMDWTGILDEDGIKEAYASYSWPNQTIIHAQYIGGHTLNILDITINRDANELMSIYDEGEPYEGSGVIGMMIFGLPGIVVALPLILLNALVHLTIRLVSGKETSKLVLWHCIKNHLPIEVSQKLNTALSKQRKLQS